MFDLINTPYKEDLPLLLGLGLREFVCETGVETDLGSVETKDYLIKVYVTCMPAQFWKFDIICKEGSRRTILETGSGTFTQYWDMAKMVGLNLVTIKSCSKE
ncbi:hypothetical protein [Pontibacter sp. SGAir0037]|uniref:hypothetical protein n=1 Tax=Pontibacter sp. SGAir0037 TaxID=2571030 RepID=UPI0010CCF6B5|nr:hypothetical protein [Pontibacter sp. SGAir0037]QCR22857.1 hypothetical protein C1N53_11220 [Pontibacter sp. SGAir0037]